MTRATQPLKRWKNNWPQPGRRDVDHMFARKGVIPVKRTRRREYPTRTVGFGSHRGMTEGSSDRSLWVKAVSASVGVGG